jgi:16S rRNA (cytosine1402-N4)-methyltransferase
MAATARVTDEPQPHIPVLLRPLIAAVSPVTGIWADGTFGAGGYTRALLEAGASRVHAIDRDPMVFDMATAWSGEYGDQLQLHRGNFAELDDLAGEPLDGVVLDLGVSSMQLDRPDRGFSFRNDGPLDMRMGDDGPTAADIVNGSDESDLADILFHYGEERASRRIARKIVARRATEPFERTADLAKVIETCLPRPKPGQSHPATRSFQAIRIAVNDEFGALVDGLDAAERALKPGGWLAVVSFHSLEDRVVKRFLQAKSGGGGRGSRYAPELTEPEPKFEIVGKAISPDEIELAENPRARSSRLRIARRTQASASPADRTALGLPKPALEGSR